MRSYPLNKQSVKPSFFDFDNLERPQTGSHSDLTDQF